MAKRKRKSKRLPRANSAATPPGPWSVLKWSAVEPQPRTEAESQPPRRRKGPVPGTVSRYLEADRKLYPELEQLGKKLGSISAAAEHLADKGKVASAGNTLTKSLAQRLRKRYFDDHQ
jgi:hypothetical protein